MVNCPPTAHAPDTLILDGQIVTFRLEGRCYIGTVGSKQVVGPDPGVVLDVLVQLARHGQQCARCRDASEAN